MSFAHPLLLMVGPLISELNKQRVDFHHIAAEMLVVTSSPVLPVFAAGYKRFLCIR
jgi:hypothetical protein